MHVQLGLGHLAGHLVGAPSDPLDLGRGLRGAQWVRRTCALVAATRARTSSCSDWEPVDDDPVSIPGSAQPSACDPRRDTSSVEERTWTTRYTEASTGRHLTVFEAVAVDTSGEVWAVRWDRDDNATGGNAVLTLKGSGG